MEKSHPSPVVVSFLPDAALRDLPDSEIGRKVIELNSGLVTCQVHALSYASMTVRFAVALGQLFEESFRRHQGEFAEWLRCAVGEDGEGRPRVSDDTARRYRTLWRKRDLIFPADEREPECRTLTEAYIKVGLLPAPLRVENESTEKPLFRLSFTVPEVPVEQWPAAEKRAFLERTQPIVDLRTKLLEVAA